MLTELSLKTRLDRSSRDVIKLNVCKNSEVPCFRCLIGRAVKMYDYSEVSCFRFRSTRVRGQHSPLSLLCITMVLRVCRIFFEITTFPNKGIPNERTTEI